MLKRDNTRGVKLGGIQVGGGALVSVQSMTNTDTRHVEDTVKQVKELEDIGCEIIRVAVKDLEAARALNKILPQINIPLIADIHFNHKLAIEAINAGVHGLRLNPGNIGGEENVASVVSAASRKKVPIRIGVNAGSLEKDLLDVDGVPTAEGMVKSALRHIRYLEKLNFKDIKISLKASHIPLMLKAYRILSDKVEYPLHVGVTEAGTLRTGSIKSAVGIGALLAEGIGDTIRVSLTGHPRHEVKVGYDILKSLGLRQRGIELISCPTCGRTEIELIPIAQEVEDRLQGIEKPLRVAVMGCAVNGPGEAKHADVGIAGGKGEGVLFRKGQVMRKVSGDKLADELVKEVYKLCEE
ncbi:MAG: flavodoxin-dependent (E)-4-hydroxy-3-methylbut-2-enyl-diphosphate synthase [Clostridiales bacterium]|nr:flavodoxin-dependent (E)-4-hydroxy-3-methylbut-2-enyl-diphosphate synthase [Clostridiales bacterium]MCF8022175.1 flavodoxin-dependent (E)-4-hydroxy-3-methylbut-2-enyl-diphosphate synthase [Clostridiales bacterium]